MGRQLCQPQTWSLALPYLASLWLTGESPHPSFPTSDLSFSLSSLRLTPLICILSLLQDIQSIIQPSVRTQADPALIKSHAGADLLTPPSSPSSLLPFPCLSQTEGGLR